MVHNFTKEECCGCGACAAICPVNCIQMKDDEEGFLYPLVDETVCVDCGLCDRACEYKRYKEPTNETCECYVGRIINEDELFLCASGGVYTALAKHMLLSGGVAAGAEVTGNKVCHTLLYDSTKVVFKHSSSKYIQSYAVAIYKEIEKLLQGGKNVLFSGTPCQIVGLKALLGRDYSNLYTADVLCAGVMSPMIFEQYINIQQENHHSEVKYFNMKYKAYGYHSFTTYIRFNDGRHISRSRLTDELMHIYTERMGDRPSCSVCNIKGVNRKSDLTLFDCWHFMELTEIPDDDKGYTNVIIHSKKGEELLLNCEGLWKKKVDIGKAIALDGNMVYGHLKPNPVRSQFYKDLQIKGIKKAVEINCPITINNKMKEKAKPLLYKTGLLNLAKRVEKGLGKKK